MSSFLIVMCVQIILESFPVSSSGHVILLEHFLRLFYSGAFIAVSESKLLSHFLHGPTAVVLAVFFWDRWTFLLKHFLIMWRIIIKIIFFAFLADIMTLIWYILFNSVIDISIFPIGLGFLISMLCLFSLRFLKREKYEVVTWQKALIIGAFQGVAFLPGVSRFGLTFVVGCWLGLSAKKSFEFSFVIQWPLIVLGFISSMMQLSYLDAYIFNFCTLLVMVVSSIIAFFALHLVYFMALANRLWVFSIVLCFSFAVWLLLVVTRVASV